MSWIQTLDLRKILFLDIETVSQEAHYDHLGETMQGLWDIKAKSKYLTGLAEDPTWEQLADSYRDKAAIQAEFGKIVCISVGVFYIKDNIIRVRLKSFSDPEEQVVLAEFTELIEKRFNDPESQFICGHNIREFDVPYICRRMIVNRMPLPRMLQLHNKKPWELKQFLDTLELWKFGDMKNYTSLKLLCGIFGVPTPKEDIDGSQVGRVFWEEEDLERIARYCEKDVLATIRVFQAMRLEPLIPDELVELTIDA
jgi:3'-5' exonuclease